MTLDQLLVFIAVADRGHVTDSAAALGVTQSAASAAIATRYLPNCSTASVVEFSLPKPGGGFCTKPGPLWTVPRQRNVCLKNLPEE